MVSSRPRRRESRGPAQPVRVDGGVMEHNVVPRRQTATPVEQERAQTPVARVPPRRQTDWGVLVGRVILALASGLFVAFVTLPLLALLMRVPLDQIVEYLGKPQVR